MSLCLPTEFGGGRDLDKNKAQHMSAVCRAAWERERETHEDHRTNHRDCPCLPF